MKIPFKIRDICLNLESYNCLQEKDLLFLTMEDYQDLNVLDEALKICKIPKSTIKKLNENEKKCVLYKLREISIGNEINVRFKCQKCGQHTENIINISNIIKYPIKKHKFISDNGKHFGNEIFDVLKGDYKEMDIDEYEELKLHISDYITTFNFTKTCICQRCLFKNQVDISKTNFIIENLSEETLNSYYKTYNTLIYFGHFSKSDIDNMMPFERSIFLGLFESQVTEKQNEFIRSK